MKLSGYLKPFQLNIFAVPVYTDNEKYYFHCLNDSYIIEGFEQCYITKENLIELNDQIRDCSIGDYGTLAFISEETTFIDSANKVIYDIKNYINENYPTRYSHLKTEINHIITKTIPDNIEIHLLAHNLWSIVYEPNRRRNLSQKPKKSSTKLARKLGSFDSAAKAKENIRILHEGISYKPGPFYSDIQYIKAPFSYQNTSFTVIDMYNKYIIEMIDGKPQDENAVVFKTVKKGKVRS